MPTSRTEKKRTSRRRKRKQNMRKRRKRKSRGKLKITQRFLQIEECIQGIKLLPVTQINP
jgi:hypothetical protein